MNYAKSITRLIPNSSPKNKKSLNRSSQYMALCVPVLTLGPSPKIGQNAMADHIPKAMRGAMRKYLFRRNRPYDFRIEIKPPLAAFFQTCVPFSDKSLLHSQRAPKFGNNSYSTKCSSVSLLNRKLIIHPLKRKNPPTQIPLSGRSNHRSQFHQEILIS